MVGGFGEAGSPIELIHALIDQGAAEPDRRQQQHGQRRGRPRGADQGRRVSKMICSYPRTANSTVFPKLYISGTTAARAGARRAHSPSASAPGGAGHPGVLHADLGGHAAGRWQGAPQTFEGREYVLEYGLTADFALIKGLAADTATATSSINKTARNFAPVMAMAGKR